MSAQHTPGLLYSVSVPSTLQRSWQVYVHTWRGVEMLRGPSGGVRKFRSEEAARAAIAKATGIQP